MTTFERAGGNRSAVHVDFMIGSPALDVDGVLPTGAAEPLMRRGEWAGALSVVQAFRPACARAASSASSSAYNFFIKRVEMNRSSAPARPLREVISVVNVTRVPLPDGLFSTRNVVFDGAGSTFSSTSTRPGSGSVTNPLNR